MSTGPNWIFDELPPSGARRGGDPAEHVFKRDLATFVREVLQNANDQRLGAAAEVHFRFRELAGEELASFREALSFETLLPHLEAAAATRGGQRLRSSLEELERGGRLLLLEIEDRHTVGLTGDESDGDSHFRALCKDTLYSHKAQAAAGGSYGLGKSVLWAFSGLSTVLFNSVLSETPTGRRSPRLIGRTELPSHALGRRWWSGSGWYGERVAVGRRGERAESLWHLAATVQSRELHLERAPVSGTSVLIVGFREPAGEEEPGIEALAARIRRAAVEYFWPAMVMGLKVTVQGEPVDVGSVELVRPFVSCWRDRSARRERLEQPGDVALEALELELPARRDGGRATRGAVSLLVRLAPEHVAHELGGHVALFRGAGMVVRYWDRRTLAQGLRPFHAILACGEAREPGAASDADREVERFLREAEPPGHDDWVSTPSLKESYRRGYLKALTQLRDQVGAALRALLAPRRVQGLRGPERLQRRFPIGERGSGREGLVSPFRFSRLEASFDGERWCFSGALEPVQRGAACAAVVRLQEIDESGAPAEAIGIAELATSSERARVELAEGAAELEVPAGVGLLRFEGRSVPLAGLEVVGELALIVEGRLRGVERAGTGEPVQGELPGVLA